MRWVCRLAVRTVLSLKSRNGRESDLVFGQIYIAGPQPPSVLCRSVMFCRFMHAGFVNINMTEMLSAH